MTLKVSIALMYLRAAVPEAALLQSPGRDDVEALDHDGVRQQRGQIFGVRLGILVDPPVVADVHQDFAFEARNETKTRTPSAVNGRLRAKAGLVRRRDEYSIA